VYGSATAPSNGDSRVALRQEDWFSSGAFTLSSHSSATDCRDVTPEQDSSLYTTQLSNTTKTTESWTRRGKPSKRRCLIWMGKNYAQNRGENWSGLAVASELMCVCMWMGIVGTSFRALLQPHCPVCLLKHILYLTHTNFSPLNTIVVDKRKSVWLTFFILKIYERFVRGFCHRKREEDWSDSTPRTVCCRPILKIEL